MWIYGNVITKEYLGNSGYYICTGTAEEIEQKEQFKYKAGLTDIQARTGLDKKDIAAFYCKDVEYKSDSYRIAEGDLFTLKWNRSNQIEALDFSLEDTMPLLFFET